MIENFTIALESDGKIPGFPILLVEAIDPKLARLLQYFLVPETPTPSIPRGSTCTTFLN